MLDSYKWMVVVGGLMMAFMGFGIGANDVANNFGSSVGSKAITLGPAILIAGVMEFIGAVVFGATVTDSVRKNVINIDRTVPGADGIRMFGNLCSLSAAGVVLFAATRYGLPVSTTHTVVGALVGFAIATGEHDSVSWRYISRLVLSWLISPFIAGILGASIFAAMRIGILRRSNPVQTSLNVLWLLVLLVVYVFVCFFFFKNPLEIPIKCGVWNGVVTVSANPCPISKWANSHIPVALLIVLGVSIVLTIVLAPVAYWRAFRTLKKFDNAGEAATSRSSSCCESSKKKISDSAKEVGGNSSRNARQLKNETSSCDADSNFQNDTLSNDSGLLDIEIGGHTVSTLDTPIHLTEVELKAEAESLSTSSSNCTGSTVGDRLSKIWKQLPWNRDLFDDALTSNKRTKNIHDRAEVFDQRAERFFSFLQIISAVVSCIVHGANDVANATAPFATIYEIYKNEDASNTVTVPVFILALGGLAIAVGLAVYGHKVIKTLGIELVKITPSRGFAIEMGMATTMVVGTFFGIPLSTTQCQVGSTVGVGLIDKMTDNGSKSDTVFLGLNLSALDFRLLAKVFASWVIAFVCAGTVSGLFFIYGVWGPTVSPYYSYIGKGLAS